MTSWLLGIVFTVVVIGVQAAHIHVHDEVFSQTYEEEETNMTIDQLITSTYNTQQDALDQINYDSDHALAELDMQVPNELFNRLYASSSPIRKKRKAVRGTRLRWTNNVMPYELVTSHFSTRDRYFIQEAMSDWEKHTCIKFRPATSRDRNRVRLQNGAGCNSALGMVGGTQVINLQAPGCRYKGLYLHEIGHALGLVHEQQLPDRDKYIRILYNNVAPGLVIWFNKYSTREVDQMGVPYQYSSVMHYGVTAFSRDGRSPTIQAIDRSKEYLIGRVYKKGLAFSDIKIVNLMYNCGAHCPANSSCTSRAGFLDKNCQCQLPTDGSGGGGGTGGGGTGGGGTGTGGGGTGGGGSGSCVDTYHNKAHCRYWSRNGYCQSRERWMTTNCKKSCNKCGGGGGSGGGGGGGGGGGTGGGSNCIDENFMCSSWAKRGECQKNPGYMLKSCRKACNQCGREECKDNEQQCSRWAGGGWCGRAVKYMSANCRKACNLCNK